MRVAIWIVCLLCTLGVASSAQGQDGEAEQLFERGLEAMKKKDYEAACPWLEQSHRLEPRVGALFTLAECQARAGTLGSAWHNFAAFLQQVEQLPAEEQEQQAQRVKEAKRRRGELEPLLSRLVIEVPTDLPPGATVERNGEPVPRGAWGTPVVVDAGSQRVVLRMPDGREIETSIELPRKATRSVRLSASPDTPAPGGGPSPKPKPKPKPEPEPEPALPSEPPPSGAQHVGAYVSFGIGAAGLIVAGIVTGVLLDKKSTVDDNCDGSVCNEVGFEATEDVPTLSVLGTVGVAVGLTGLAVGTILLLTVPDEETSARMGWRLTGAHDTDLGIGIQRSW